MTNQFDLTAVQQHIEASTAIYMPPPDATTPWPCTAVVKDTEAFASASNYSGETLL